ncbi:MAG TPA: carboxypeptidase-like regulatory domain-containing protein [Pyrinomonadaceae bacterium]
MNIKSITRLFLSLLLLSAATAVAAPAQQQDKTTGGVKGKVRVETGSSAGVTVVVRRGDDEVRSATTDGRGEFEVRGLKPGSYGLTFRKTGLKVGKVEGVEVRAGKVRSLGGGLYMSMDEGALAIIQGSVFNQDGKSLTGAKVELALLSPDGAAKKLESRLSSIETGRFVFKLTPEAARYRLTATAPGRQPATQEVTVDGAAIYRVALSLAPAAK